MEILAERDFLCSICGKHAATVQLRAGQVAIESFACRSESSISPSDEETLRAAISSGDMRALHECDSEFAPFFCPRCNACYCGEHWKHWDVFEDDGWFDCVQGICPQGHERTLVD